MLFNLAKSATFSLALYGDEASLGLANGWACRLQQFFDVWVAHDRSPAFAFDRPHVDGLNESLECLALASSEHEATKKRAEQIRRIVPRR